eukprot:744885-Pleurochrysis_carterae.AAC.2
MRRTFVASSCCPERFMTPVGDSVVETLDAQGARANSGWQVRAALSSVWASEFEARTHRALPEASRVKATSPPSRAMRALRAASGRAVSWTSVSAAARAALESTARRSCFVEDLSPFVRRLGQSLCQWAPLHQRQGAHLSLHLSFGSGRGRFGSAVFARSSFPRTANACAAFGFSSSSRRTLRTSASLSTLRAALIVSERSPTPALRESLTSKSVDRLSFRRRTALATFSDNTESGSCAASGRERFKR